MMDLVKVNQHATMNMKYGAEFILYTGVCVYKSWQKHNESEWASIYCI